jgi:hypothetical protein
VWLGRGQLAHGVWLCDDGRARVWQALVGGWVRRQRCRGGRVATHRRRSSELAAPNTHSPTYPRQWGTSAWGARACSLLMPWPSQQLHACAQTLSRSRAIQRMPTLVRAWWSWDHGSRSRQGKAAALVCLWLALGQAHAGGRASPDAATWGVFAHARPARLRPPVGGPTRPRQHLRGPSTHTPAAPVSCCCCSRPHLLV